jgi:hypothetical protein
MAQKHFLEKAHLVMVANNLGHLWTPGSTTWRHFSWVSESTIKKAQRDGYLSKGTDIPRLTKKGYLKY